MRLKRANMPSAAGAEPHGPRGYPLLGVLPRAWKNPLQFFVEAARDYGDVVRLDFGPRRLLLLTHPASIKYVLQENNRNYAKGYDQAKFLIGNGLVSSEGEFWRRQRRLMQPAFHRQRIAGYAATMIDETRHMLDRWQHAARRRQPLDVGTEMMRLTQGVVLRTLFSTSVGEQVQEIGHAFDVALAYLNQRMFSPSSLLDRLPTRATRRFRSAMRTLDEAVYRIIDERRSSGDDAGDVLSMLLLARDEATGEGMSDMQLRDEVMTLYLAGHETTANALAWTWYLLAGSPEVEGRLHAELEAVLAGRAPQVEDVPRLTYARQVIDESLRLYPPVWVFGRKVIEDDEVGGYHLPADTMLLISPYVTQRLPEFWPDPDRFDPERFSPQAASDRPAFAYLPFGGGPRVCLGNTFALVEAQLVLAMVAQRYRLRLVPDERVEPRSIATLQPHPGLSMTLHPRSRS